MNIEQNIAIKKSKLLYRILCGFVAFTFVFSLIIAPLPVLAQSALKLPSPGLMVTPSIRHSPAIITGMTLHPENPLRLDFIISTGDDHLQGEEFKKESQKLINYFLATLTVPDDEMWVNLSPYEKDKIIANGLGLTEMGRDMLAQDYMLKQLTASLMYPEKKLGDAFWQRVYEKSQSKFGTTDIPTNTFNKVWIVPEEAVVYVNGANVFVSESHLKVMLEEDYLAIESNLDYRKHNREITKEKIEILSRQSKELIGELILPEIEKEVNEGKNFANLRQIYHSMILATWYKKNLKESVLGKVYIDTNKINGIELKDKNVPEKIYHQYIKAFKRGVYNYLQEDYDSVTQKIIPRKYFSGGLKKTTVRTGRPHEKISETSRIVADPKRGVEVAIIETDFSLTRRNALDLATTENDRAMLTEIKESVSQVKIATDKLVFLGWRDTFVDGWKGSERRNTAPLALEAAQLSHHPTMELPVPEGSMTLSFAKTQYDHDSLKEKAQDIMFTKIEGTLRDIFIGKGEIPSIDQIQNADAQRRLIQMVREKMQTGGKNLLKHKTALPSALRTQNELEKFYNWVVGNLAEIGYPADRNTKPTINDSAFEDAIDREMRKHPEKHAEADEYFQSIGYQNFYKARNKLGMRKAFTLLLIGNIKWTTRILEAAKALTLTEANSYPLVATKMEAIFIDKVLKEKIINFISSRTGGLAALGGQNEITSSYNPINDVLVLAPTYLQESIEAESVESNPLDVIRSIVHESRHRQILVEAGIMECSGYGEDSNIRDFEEGRVNLETEMIIKQLANHIGSRESGDPFNLHLLSNVMLSPLDYRKTPGQFFFTSDTDMYMGVLLTQLTEYAVKGRNDVLRLEGEELLQGVQTEIASELRQPGSSIIRDNFLIGGAKYFEQTKNVLQIETAFEEFLQLGMIQNQKLLKGTARSALGESTTAANLEEARLMAAAGYQINQNKKALSKHLRILSESRYDLRYVLTLVEQDELIDTLLKAYSIAKWGNIRKILGVLPNQKSKRFFHRIVKDGLNGDGISEIGFLGDSNSIELLRQRMQVPNLTTTIASDILYAVSSINLDDNLDLFESILSGDYQFEDAHNGWQVLALTVSLIGKTNNITKAKKILETQVGKHLAEVHREIEISLNELNNRDSGKDNEIKKDGMVFRKVRTQSEHTKLENILKRNKQPMQVLSLSRRQNFNNGLEEQFPRESYLAFEEATGRLLGGAVYYVEREKVYLAHFAVHPALEESNTIETQLLRQFAKYLKKRGFKTVVNIMDRTLITPPKKFNEKHNFISKDGDFELQVDNAQLTSSSMEIPGGINLNPEMLNLKEHGQAIEFTLNNTAINNIQAHLVYGISAIIINIIPITNFSPLLGSLDNPDREKQISIL